MANPPACGIISFTLNNPRGRQFALMSGKSIVWFKDVNKDDIPLVGGKGGLDGISIGSNDLTQLILGVDRDSGKLSKTFDERDEAVMMALEKVVKQSKKLGITSSICGQAPSDYPDITRKLVTWGITSVSVNPDVIGSTREVVARTEAKLKAR